MGKRPGATFWLAVANYHAPKVSYGEHKKIVKNRKKQLTNPCRLCYIMRAAEESGEKIKPGESPKELKKIMRTNKNEIKHMYRFIARVPYCDAQALISGGEAAGVVHEIGRAGGIYGWNWTAYRFTATSGAAVAVVTGCRDLFGNECREITRKYEEKARAVDCLGVSWKKAAAKYAKLCRDFADAVIFAEEFSRLDADKKSGLLTEWDGGYMTFEPLQKIATRAAESVRDFVKIEAGDDRGNAGAVFGLPYTSGGEYAAVWNVNTQARATIAKTGEPAYFNGVAIERTKDGKPQAVTVWEVGSPYKFLTLAEVRAQFVRIR